MDSPRGRIHLLGQDPSGVPGDVLATHVDNCLGCLGCVTACPSGVRYDLLIADARARVERRPRPVRERLLREALFRLFPYPRRLRLLRGPLRAYRLTGLDRLGERLADGLGRLSPAAGALAALAPRPGRTPWPGGRLPTRVRAGVPGRPRAVVGMLTGCVQDALFPAVNAATARVLAADGCDVVIPRRQGCCGALSGHSGRVAEARRFARGVIDAFADAGVDHVVINSAGCGSAVKEYGRLLADDPLDAARAAELAARARDVTEVLAALAADGPVAPRHPLPVAVAYHDACHLSHGQRVRTQPRDLLRAVPGLDLREIADGDLCCGSAGVWNVLNPEPGADLGARKARAVLATGARVLAAGNPGCLMQVAAAARRVTAERIPAERITAERIAAERITADRRGAGVAVLHTVQVLDASIRGLPPSALWDLGR
jgi:glycolate oxidase iron-sulfur subunit